MRGQKRKPFSKTSNPLSRLSDSDIKKSVTLLSSLQNKHFPQHRKWLEIEKVLSIAEANTLKLCKLLYCIGYRKEMFLHMGTVLESRINAIVLLYTTNNWRTPSTYVDQASQTIKFEQFVQKKTLSEKADLIVNYNLFNNMEVSDQIRHKIQAFRFLRNYGGHSKNVNQFLQLVVDNQPDCDLEIEDTFSLIKSITLALAALQSTPPHQI